MLPLFQDSPSRWFSSQVPGWGWGWNCCCGGGIGYTAGGQFGSHLATADKTDFAAETTAAVTTANLSQARSQYPAGAVNPGLAAYFLGGQDASGILATADKLAFASDVTSAATTANLANVQMGAAAVSERSTKAYVAGGFSVAATSPVVNAHQLTFAGDSTAAQTSANLSQARYNLCGITEGATKGYWLGGATNVGSGVVVKTADKITFSSDATAAQTTANLTVQKVEGQAVSDGATYGYFLGGSSGPAVSGNVDRLTFSTDATAARTSMSLTRSSGAGMSSGTEAIIGGFNGVNSNTLSKLVFATEAISATLSSANLTTSRNYFGMACTVGL